LSSRGFSRKLSRALVLSAFLLTIPHATTAQESSSVDDPAAVLRNILVASCSQDTKRFSAYLTSRNSAAFAAMATASQAALLKRFVLVDQPGTPQTDTDKSGNLLVRCATTSVTTLLQIGKPEIRDNVAYLPLTVSDAKDPSAADSRRVVMGLVRENDHWKLLSLGLLLLDLPTLAEEWDRQQIQSNETSAVASIKELAAAIEKYRVTYTHLPKTLAELGPPKTGAAKSENAGLVGFDLASGRKDGYFFRYVIVGASDLGAPAVYELAAIPVEYGRTGMRSFFRDNNGLIHGGDHQGAVGTTVDPKVD
jgi:hypothetical protein